jgi:acyl-CoA reductase-like NAD-dependent aldehyde dehydrogenase
MTKKQVTKKQSSGRKTTKATQSETVAAPSRKAASGYLLCGKEHTAGKAVPVLSPWNQAVVGAVPLATRAQALIAVAGAEKSFSATRSLPAHERQRILAEVSAAIAARRAEFAATIVAEAGKPLKAAQSEVDRAAFTFKTASEEAGRECGEVLPLDLLPGTEGRFGLLRRFPVGPVLAITPFNFPLNLVAHKLAPAIAAGCPVVLKPAPQTPLSALALGKLIVDAGWPAEALSVLPMANEDAEWLVEHEERLKMLSFTGSARVGWQLKARAGKKKVMLELGGNAAMIVHSDCGDLAAVVDRAVVGGFTYSGQSCISVQRILVERPIFQTFTWKMVEAAARLVCGDPANARTDIGPVIRESDAMRIVEWADEALAQGARIVAGGVREGSMVEPTILSGTRSPMKVVDEEVFGPVVCIDAYDDFDSALERANQSRFGLQTGLFTRDMSRILRAYERLDVGALIVGDSPSWRLDSMPYGGVKDSGEGHEGVRWAIGEMTQSKLLVLAR